MSDFPGKSAKTRHFASPRRLTARLPDVGTGTALPSGLIPESAFQCGFCRAGFVVSAAALLSDGRRRSRQELAGELTGNICRCTGYEPILEAVLRCQA